ncbi:MAG TPA: twin-arginine translocase TatA/TatE family subunit [Thermoanaerobaculia bacterium]|nr:twin-arginine translocase TatA/TatE family subunit [Thermoanaerobaculia bacterium]
MLAVLGPLGVPELLVIFLILVLLFGAKKLPQIGRGIGEGIRNLKSGLNQNDEEAEREREAEEPARYQR